MTRVLALLCALAPLVLATVAEAQDDDARRAQLSSIDAEATAATALYVTGPILMAGGLGSAIGIGLANLCVSGSCGDRTGVEVGVAVSLVFAGLGLLSVIPAIVLDVDSGQRRRALLSLAPSPFGATGWLTLAL